MWHMCHMDRSVFMGYVRGNVRSALSLAACCSRGCDHLGDIRVLLGSAAYTTWNAVDFVMYVSAEEIYRG